ncbi:MAG: 4Fe-4S dicluster domain-containing protein [Chloroflexi bacterium]|nr:4Fe-4S dicluster domain-containing protein [Chloroflexota bacterium]
MKDKLSRREFLKYAGTGTLAFAVLPIFDRAALAPYLSGENGSQVGVLVDTTRCIGCRACQLACKEKNNLPADAPTLPPNRTFPESLSATTFSLVEFRRVGGDDQHPEIRPVKKQCMHCLEPACVSVCPVAAMQKTARGPVVYDAEKCIGCRYCMLACPFNVPKFEWDSANPRIRKCQMCADLIEQGKLPACVQACPVQALTFGTRAELIAEAQARVSGAPAKYIPYIYGLNEVAGTSFLYLANVPFDQLGFAVNLPDTPLPDNTRQVLEKLPAVAAGIGLFLGGAAWWNARRARHE